MVSLAELREYIGDQFVTDEALTLILDTATETVKRYAGKSWENIPTATQNTAVMECGSKIHARRSSPNGSFDDGTGTPVMAPRDPLITVYPLLHGYVVNL